LKHLLVLGVVVELADGFCYFRIGNILRVKAIRLGPEAVPQCNFVKVHRGFFDHKIGDKSSLQPCILFGDGAGAVVLEASQEPGILSTHLHADGSYEKLLHVPFGISQGYQKLLQGEAYMQMKGNEVFRMAVNTLGRIADETLKHNNMPKSDVDWLVPHQANTRIIKAAAKKLDIDMDRVVVTVDQHGNTSAASVPLALDTAVRDGRIKKGEIIIMEAFDGGFTWGSALLKF